MDSPRRVAWLASIALLLAACGGGGSAGDGASAHDSFPGPIEPGPPISAAANTWTWVPIDGTACGNGSATGIGVNPTAASTDVVVYLQGGGACWDDLTCFTIGTASNLDGYGQTAFATEPVLGAELFDRAAAGNPFQHASYVFVPYCTGDLHAGDEVHGYVNGTVHHVGARNLEAILSRLAGTFTGTRRVFASGSSAGGYGVELRFHRFVTAFPDAEVHGLADGAQPVQPANGLIPTAIAAWNLQLPPGCAACSTSFPALADHLGATWPGHRIGLTASTDDGTLRFYFGYPDALTFSTATRALLASDAYGPTTDQRYFAKKIVDHTMLGHLEWTTDTSTLTLRDWVVQWRDGDPLWANQAPAP